MGDSSKIYRNNSYLIRGEIIEGNSLMSGFGGQIKIDEMGFFEGSSVFLSKEYIIKSGIELLQILFLNKKGTVKSPENSKLKGQILSIDEVTRLAFFKIPSKQAILSPETMNYHLIGKERFYLNLNGKEKNTSFFEGNYSINEKFHDKSEFFVTAKNKTKYNPSSNYEKVKISLFKKPLGVDIEDLDLSLATGVLEKQALESGGKFLKKIDTFLSR